MKKKWFEKFATCIGCITRFSCHLFSFTLDLFSFTHQQFVEWKFEKCHFGSERKQAGNKAHWICTRMTLKCWRFTMCIDITVHNFGINWTKFSPGIIWAENIKCIQLIEEKKTHIHSQRYRERMCVRSEIFKRVFPHIYSVE